ncbi:MULTISPECIES: SCO2523 family variant P-loop protein [Frankia]|uniref:Nucleotide-binding protein n=1 Tax=Frankia alni (strain DSM 45986 / CECT 9034 / ACN14a) TaxID=326424 RepID=Q0RTQ2_FRAAA|nr:MULTISPECIES: SCO2523 family variant P-loop protein [Frankia]CAJ59046.1 putative Nucleotide-binding protein [Frankia alni ACN14a]
MIVLATSDKGGTGRSVTTTNVAYRRALQGDDVCYLDFDFGSPTAGAVFDVEAASRGVKTGTGAHSYFQGDAAEPVRIDVWKQASWSRRRRPTGSGRLVLVPGDEGGGEFPISVEMIGRCRRLLVRLAEEFSVILIDLSAGRSYAADLVQEATAAPDLGREDVRWLVFHRWTRQHILAAHGLVFGERGIVSNGIRLGLSREEMESCVRFVRTAVQEPNSPLLSPLRAQQASWLQRCHNELVDLAARRRLGRSMVIGAIPLDPVLQWREQIIRDLDISSTQIANRETGEAFEDLARKLTDPRSWQGT